MRNKLFSAFLPRFWGMNRYFAYCLIEYHYIVLFMRITQASNQTKWRTRGERELREETEAATLSSHQSEELRLAAAQMTGAARRAFQAEMTLKYCHGSARFAETLLGWSRDTVEVGLAERRTGLVCV